MVERLPDAVRAVLAAQERVASRQQLLAAGLGDGAVRHLVRSGRWQVLHPGVYLAHTGPPPPLTRLHAALLHAGPGSAAGGLTAAHLYGLVDEAPRAVHVLVPGDRRQQPRPGVRLERRLRLAERVHPARVPSVLRIEEVVLDLADSATRAVDVLQWPAQACQRRLTTPDRIARALEARRQIRWRMLLQRALADVADGAESGLEVSWATDVERAHGLPRGRRNRVEGSGGPRTDVRYEQYATRVELDGRRYHQGRDEHDIERDLDVLLGGEVTVRAGWAATVVRPCRTALALAGLLQQRGWAGGAQPCRKAVCAVRAAAGP